VRELQAHKEIPLENHGGGSLLLIVAASLLFQLSVLSNEQARIPPEGHSMGSHILTDLLLVLAVIGYG
jgi:hypothetical protein